MVENENQKESPVGVNGLDNVKPESREEDWAAGDFADEPRPATRTENVTAEDPTPGLKTENVTAKDPHEVEENPEDHIGDLVRDPWEKREDHFEVDDDNPGAKPVDGGDVPLGAKIEGE